MTGVNADGGFGDNSLASGLSAIVGTIGRCCLVQVLWLNVAGHTTPGAAGMGGIKVCVFVGEF